MRKTSIKSVFGILLAVSVAVGMTAGCSKQNGASKFVEVEGDILPVSEPVTLTQYGPNNLQVLTDYSEMGCYKELEKITGVKIDYQHPVSGQAKEQFNVMIASGEYPDLIMNVEGNYAGGLAKACEDGVIYELSELIDKYAPNIKKLFEEYPQLKMMSSDDEGHIYALPMIRGGSILRTYRGLIIRQDYLDKFGLSMPETIDDWHNVLTVFKQNGVKYPFTTKSNFFKLEPFVGAYGLNHSYILKDGKVTWSPYEDVYKDYVQLMADWYKEGLIDPEITTNTQKMEDSKVLNNEAGAIIGTTGNDVGGYNSLAKIEGFDLAAAPYPVLNKGDKPYVIQRDPIVQTNLGISISTCCENVPVAMAYIDYAYSKEGHMLFNFGVEGESYEMKDGYPTFTDEVTKNSEGLSMAKAGSKYALSFTQGAFVQDTKYAEQFYGMPRQIEAGKVWCAAAEEYTNKNIAVLGVLSPEEATEIADIENNIKTYADEMFTKWVLGQQSLDNWSDYKKQLENMGVKRAIEIKQQAYERYIKKYPEMKNPKDFEPCEFYWNE